MVYLFRPSPHNIRLFGEVFLSKFCIQICCLSKIKRTKNLYFSPTLHFLVTTLKTCMCVSF